MKRRGPPPLPKEDIKIILRPHRGLLVKNILGLELSRAVIDACQQSFNGNDFLLRIHPGSNIVILSTPSEDVASRLREMSQLNIRGTTHSFNAYVADPEGVLRGIVHGIPAGTSQAELMENLRVRTQGVKIERARMLGSSKTAIITFTGRVLPRSVYMMGAELICYPYKPTVQVCKICLLTGHRTDVCPTPNVNVCPKCGAREPTLGHHCTPKCAICDGEHPTGDSLCKKKLKSVAPPRKSRMEQPKKRGDQPEWTCDANSDSEFPQLELHKHRWFSSEREEQHQSRSRSQSPSSSRSISQSRNQWQINNGSTVSAHPGSSSLKKQNKSGGPQTKTGSLQAKESKDPQAAGRTNKNQKSWKVTQGRRGPFKPGKLPTPNPTRDVDTAPGATGWFCRQCFPFNHPDNGSTGFRQARKAGSSTQATQNGPQNHIPTRRRTVRTTVQRRNASPTRLRGRPL
ncbi:hypothetical protein HPB49_021082 [Dermacentor silvarum]|uniref:Uncharacterized protein n=1 Tax=Dermacentor silvarum TaxID=543639 RepID=A0ACB8CBE0_DERSI|nr:hypothetical protein HPB49_021082 [Dermacentor silvarum]